MLACMYWARHELYLSHKANESRKSLPLISCPCSDASPTTMLHVHTNYSHCVNFTIAICICLQHCGMHLLTTFFHVAAVPTSPIRPSLGAAADRAAAHQFARGLSQRGSVPASPDSKAPSSTAVVSSPFAADLAGPMPATPQQEVRTPMTFSLPHCIASWWAHHMLMW